MASSDGICIDGGMTDGEGIQCRAVLHVSHTGKLCDFHSVRHPKCMTNACSLILTFCLTAADGAVPLVAGERFLPLWQQMPVCAWPQGAQACAAPPQVQDRGEAHILSSSLDF